MRIRNGVLVLIGALTAASLQARHLTPDEALSRAVNQPQTSASIKLAPADVNLSTKLVYSADINNKSMAYVFKNEDHGFMVVSADDVAVPLLGYSDDTDFDPENIPDNFKAWLDGYAQQISYAANNASFAGAPIVTKIERTERPAVAPKLTTTWNQNAPYWNDCPTLNGERCYSGCIATAMAQVMNYHKWPEKGQGNISYNWTTGNQTLSCDFADMTFDWDKMLDKYKANSPAENCAAVAQLMKACGYASKMNYSPSGSGSTIGPTAEGLIKYFDYDRSLCIQKREWYDDQEWEDLMYTELTTNGPVFHTGASYSGGHAFVCDGYSANGYFHFNWGWGGISDGYFLLNALNPGSHGIGGNNSGYNMNQMILQNFTKSKAGSLPTAIIYSYGGFTTSTTSTTVESKVTFTPSMTSLGFENYSILPIQDVTIGIKCVNSNNSNTTYLSAFTYPSLQPNERFDSISVVLPNTLEDGSYIVSPVFRTGSGEWTDMKANPLYNNAIIMTVNGNLITFTNKGADIKIEASDITLLSEISPTYHFYIRSKYTNVGKKEFNGYIQARFLDETGKAVAAAQSFNLTLSPQQQATITYMSYIVQGSLTGGNYYLAFYSVSQQEYINEPLPITVVEEPNLTCSKIVMDNPNSVYYKDVKVNATISCSDSEYTGPIAFLAFNEDNMYFPADYFFSSTPNFANGDTQNVVVTGTLQNCKAGQLYVGEMAFLGKDGQFHRIGNASIRFKVTNLLEFTCSQLRISGASSVDCNNVTISANVTCESGNYNGPLAFIASSSSEDLVPVGMFLSEDMTLSVKESKAVSFSGVFEEGEVGRYYYAALAYKCDDGTYHQIGTSMVRFRVTAASGIDDLTTEQQIKATVIYPNPAESMATLESPTAIKSVEVYSLSGASLNVPSDIDGNIATLNVAALPAGTYIVAVTGTDASRQATKLIKR